MMFTRDRAQPGVGPFVILALPPRDQLSCTARRVQQGTLLPALASGLQPGTFVAVAPGQGSSTPPVVPPDRESQMRVLLILTSLTAGAVGCHAVQRYGPTFLFWIFTTDTRSTR